MRKDIVEAVRGGPRARHGARTRARRLQELGHLAPCRLRVCATWRATWRRRARVGGALAAAARDGGDGLGRPGRPAGRREDCLRARAWPLRATRLALDAQHLVAVATLEERGVGERGQSVRTLRVDRLGGGEAAELLTARPPLLRLTPVDVRALSLRRALLRMWLRGRRGGATTTRLAHDGVPPVRLSCLGQQPAQPQRLLLHLRDALAHLIGGHRGGSGRRRRTCPRRRLADGAAAAEAGTAARCRQRWRGRQGHASAAATATAAANTADRLGRRCCARVVCAATLCLPGQGRIPLVARALVGGRDRRGRLIVRLVRLLVPVVLVVALVAADAPPAWKRPRRILRVRGRPLVLRAARHFVIVVHAASAIVCRLPSMRRRHRGHGPALRRRWRRWRLRRMSWRRRARRHGAARGQRPQPRLPVLLRADSQREAADMMRLSRGGVHDVAAAWE